MENKFKFSIIDDTDDGTVENLRPVYDLLYKNKIFITKTVWVYPPRDKNSNGDSLQRKEYLDFIKELHEKGFEIALHNVGSGDYERMEILKGLEFFKKKLGFYPSIHINHSYNKDSIYGGYKRFNWPVKNLIKLLYPQYREEFEGDIESSKYFWGDIHKDIITYSRNHEFPGLITSKFDKLMPYVDPKRSKYSNYWFSASFAPNQNVFKLIMSKKNIDELSKKGGNSIIYTHFGYFVKDGILDKDFINSINYIAKKKNGRFLTVSKLLNSIVSERKNKYPTIKYFTKLKFEFFHLLTRIYYRKIFKIDDYAFKNLNKNMFLKK